MFAGSYPHHWRSLFSPFWFSITNLDFHSRLGASVSLTGRNLDNLQATANKWVATLMKKKNYVSCKLCKITIYFFNCPINLQFPDVKEHPLWSSKAMWQKKKTVVGSLIVALFPQIWSYSFFVIPGSKCSLVFVQLLWFLPPCIIFISL